MANAILHAQPKGSATPLQNREDDDDLDLEDQRVNNENHSNSAVAEDTDKVVESVDSTHGSRRKNSSRQDDEMSLVDCTEETTRQNWSEDKKGANQKRKREISNPSKAKASKSKKHKRSKFEHSDTESSSEESSSSDDESSSSSSDSDSDHDDELFDPKSNINENKGKVPNHIVNYIEKYATKGIDKKNRQDVSSSLPVPTSNKLKGLKTDRFFKKNYFKGRKWNGKLEKNKINTQLRILDVMGPLSLLWTEAERLKKAKQGMDPSDIIQLTQRAIVLAGNAHYVFNTDRRKAVLSQTMPDNLDLLSEKKGQKALAKSKDQLFGKKFLRVMAKENKDNKDLKEMLSSYSKRGQGRKKHYNSFGKPVNDRNGQFFQNRPTNNLQFVGGRRGDQPREPLQGISNRNNNFQFQRPNGGYQNQSQNRQFKKNSNR